MRNRLLSFIVSVAVFASLSVMGSAQSVGAAKSPVERDIAGMRVEAVARLDDLFDDLKREANERSAQRISRQIWDAWMVSGSPTVDLMMGWANEATQAKKYDVALDFLDQVVTLAPDFAEGWNRRATVHYLRNDFAKSIADIEKTLALEPRHFGALAGLASIMEATGRDALALQANEQILDVYPMNRQAQKQVVELSDKLSGQGI
jgi:tetratricopeptide (TPR) repeat protein